MKELSRVENPPYCNTYIYGEKEGEAVLVDPGNPDGRPIVSFLKKHNMTLRAVLLTHGHFDHMAGLPSLLEEFPAPVYLGAEDLRCLGDGKYSCARFFGEDFSLELSDPILLSGGETLDMAGEKIEAIATPFHTAGSLCYYLPERHILFSGDTLFKGSIGRTDLPGNAYRKTNESLKKLLLLPDDTKVYPGHGERTSIREEKAYNPYLSRL